MHNRAWFWKPFGSERINYSQKLLKSAEKYFFTNFSSFSAKLSHKKLFLIRTVILGLLVNILTGSYEYSRSNRENLQLPIEIKLSKKPCPFCIFFLPFWNLYKISNVLNKRNQSHRSTISEVIDPKRCAYLNA